MPKKAFFSLPGPKQDVFFDTALRHFSRTPYQQASLSSLLRELEIPKGTFYLYFHHKLDLYTYLIDTVLGMRTVYIKSRLVREPTDFFHVFESLLRLETTFRLEHPVFNHLLSLALDSRFSPLPSEQLRQLEQERIQLFHGMLVRDQLRGKIVPEADAAMVTFLSGVLLEEFYHLVRQRMHQQKRASSEALPVSYAEMTAQCSRRMMTLIRRALSAKTQSNGT